MRRSISARLSAASSLRPTRAREGRSRRSFQARQPSGRPLIGGVSFGVAAERLEDASLGEGGRCAAGRLFLDQLLDQRLGFRGAAQFEQRVGAAQQQRRVVGIDPLHRFAVELLGFGVATERGGGGGQAHAVMHGRRVVGRRLGLTVFAHGIERVTGGHAHALGPSAARQVRDHDGDQVDQATEERHEEDQEDPVELLVGSHHVDAERHRDQQGENTTPEQRHS